MFEAFSNIPTAKQYYWTEFVAKNSSDFSDQVQMFDEIRKVHRFVQCWG